jgi:DNA ligase-1
MLILRHFFSTQKAYSPIEQLESIYKLTIAVNGTSSTIEKQALLHQFPASHSTLKRIYDPHLRHFLSSKAMISYLQRGHAPQLQQPVFNNLNALLDALSSRTITGHAACDAVATFYSTYCQTEAHKNIFWKILDRNLKMGVSIKTIRHLLSSSSSSSSLPPIKDKRTKNTTHISVALASPYTSTKKNPFDVTDDNWYVSQKLDGIRCIAMIQSINDIQFFSRTGRPFTSLQKVKDDIEKRLIETQQEKTEFVLDGEICAYNEDTKNEDFLKAMGQVRRINEDMENPIYQVFDRIQLQQFLDTKGDEKFSTRQAQLKQFVGTEDTSPHLKLVEQIKLSSMDQLESTQRQAIQKGWEGLILRKDVVYEGKRTYVQ